MSVPIKAKSRAVSRFVIIHRKKNTQAQVGEASSSIISSGRRYEMSLNRREFLGVTAAAGLAGIVRVEGQPVRSARRGFLHGVASGGPLVDSVILWTRVSAAPGAAPAVSPEVVWELASDPKFTRVVLRGTTT